MVYCGRGPSAVAAVASYEHAYALVQAHGESGWIGRLVPLTLDGLIYASSMVVMLDSARRKAPVPRAGALAARPGDFRPSRQYRPRPGPWPDRRGGGRVASDRAGRLVRTPYDGHQEFSDASGR